MAWRIVVAIKLLFKVNNLKKKKLVCLAACYHNSEPSLMHGTVWSNSTNLVYHAVRFIYIVCYIFSKIPYVKLCFGSLLWMFADIMQFL